MQELQRSMTEIESVLGLNIKGPVESHVVRKIEEIVKEEKLAIDRANTLRSNLGKRLKELSTNGVFS
jgi:hypothetical protein